MNRILIIAFALIVFLASVNSFGETPSTVGMYGDLQGIAGKSLQEIEGLEFPALGTPVAINGNAVE